MYANVNFREKDSAAFLPEDFLGRSNRAERGAQEFKDRLAVQRANAALMQIKAGDVPEDLPDWAKG